MSTARRKERGAEDPAVVAQGILAIAQGKRDEDAGKFVDKSGQHPW